MGLTSYEEVLKKSKVSTDPALNAQVTRVGRRIAEATGHSPNTNRAEAGQRR